MDAHVETPHGRLGMTRIIEILMYTLKPGSGLDFHQIMMWFAELGVTNLP
jgi:hypothetical protein